jgi:hypothetical protein
MSMRELQHYTVRFRESQRLRYRLPRLAWRFLTRVPPNRATHREPDRAKIRLARRPTARRSHEKMERAAKQETP